MAFMANGVYIPIRGLGELPGLHFSTPSGRKARLAPPRKGWGFSSPGPLAARRDDGIAGWTRPALRHG